MAFFIELEQFFFFYFYGNTEEFKQSKQSQERKTVLEKSGSLTSDYITKIQSSKQYGPSTKIGQWNSIERPVHTPQLLEPTHCGACVPLLLSLCATTKDMCPGAHALLQEKPLQLEHYIPQLESSSSSQQPEKACAKIQHSQK